MRDVKIGAIHIKEKYIKFVILKCHKFCFLLKQNKLFTVNNV